MKPELFLIISFLFSTNLSLSAQEQSTVQQEPDFSNEESILIAPPETTQDDTQSSMDVFSPWYVVRMVLVLALVVLFIFLIFHFLKKAAGDKYQNSELIRMHGAVSLSSGKSMHLVEVGDEIFLVGAGDAGINLISKIEDKETVDSIRLKSSASKAGQGNRMFADFFSKFVTGTTRTAQRNQSTLTKSKGFLGKQRQRLKGI